MIFTTANAELAFRNVRLAANQHPARAKDGQPAPQTALSFQSLRTQARQTGARFCRKFTRVNNQTTEQLKWLSTKAGLAFARFKLEMTGVAQEVRQLQAAELDQLQQLQDEQMAAMLKKLDAS